MHGTTFKSLVAELQRHQFDFLLHLLSAFFMPYWAVILFTLGFFEGGGPKNKWGCWAAWLCATAPVALYLFVLFSGGDPRGWVFLKFYWYGPLISPIVTGIGGLAGVLLFRVYQAIAKPSTLPPAKEMPRLFRARTWRIVWASIAACFVGTALLLLWDKKLFLNLIMEQNMDVIGFSLVLIISLFFVPYWAVITLTAALSFFKGNDALNDWRCWGAWLCATILVAFNFSEEFRFYITFFMFLAFYHPLLQQPLVPPLAIFCFAYAEQFLKSIKPNLSSLDRMRTFLFALQMSTFGVKVDMALSELSEYRP